jgi:hypothetical protein
MSEGKKQDVTDEVEDEQEEEEEDLDDLDGGCSLNECRDNAPG